MTTTLYFMLKKTWMLWIKLIVSAVHRSCIGPLNVSTLCVSMLPSHCDENLWSVLRFFSLILFIKSEFFLSFIKKAASLCTLECCVFAVMHHHLLLEHLCLMWLRLSCWINKHHMEMMEMMTLSRSYMHFITLEYELKLKLHSAWVISLRHKS